MGKLKAPGLGKLILPSLTREQVDRLISMFDNARDSAIIAEVTESGLRTSGQFRYNAERWGQKGEEIRMRPPYDR